MRARLLVPILFCALLALLDLFERNPSTRVVEPARLQDGDLLHTSLETLPGGTLGQSAAPVLELQRLPSAEVRLSF